MGSARRVPNLDAVPATRGGLGLVPLTYAETRPTRVLPAAGASAGMRLRCCAGCRWRISHAPRGPDVTSGDLIGRLKGLPVRSTAIKRRTHDIKCVCRIETRPPLDEEGRKQNRSRQNQGLPLLSAPSGSFSQRRGPPAVGP